MPVFQYSILQYDSSQYILLKIRQNLFWSFKLVWTQLSKFLRWLSFQEYPQYKISVVRKIIIPQPNQR